MECNLEYGQYTNSDIDIFIERYQSFVGKFDLRLVDEMTKTNIAQFPLIHRDLLLRDKILETLSTSDSDTTCALNVLMDIYTEVLAVLDEDKKTICIENMHQMLEERL